MNLLILYLVVYGDKSQYKSFVGADTTKTKEFSNSINNIYNDYKTNLAEQRSKAAKYNEQIRQLDIKFVTDTENYTEQDKNLRKELKSKVDSINNDVDKFIISRYATENIDEFMAEGFTDYILGTNKSKYSLEIGKLIDKYYGRNK